MGTQKKRWKAISLFAGAGGCSLGFKHGGVDIVAAFEKAEPAIATYNRNFGKGLCHNVDLETCDFYPLRHMLGLHRGELDLVIGGPPCQGFTTAGSRFWNDPRNKLVQNYAKALEIFYPRWFMMENVEGILTTANGIYIVECLKKMIALGYTLNLKKVYMQEYAVPQRRKRVIIIGNREGKRFDFPEPVELASGSIYKNSSFTLEDAIRDLEWCDIPEIDHIRKKENGIQLERILALKTGQTMKDLPEHLQHSSFKRRASRRVCDGTPTEKRGGPPSGLKRLSYKEPCLTITSASLSEFIHPTQHRMLTIRECARVQTFPDSFQFCGTDAQKILQIGNAIPPVFAKIMAKQMMACDENASDELGPSLARFDVTKATAKSPALQKTCRLLSALQIQEYEQLQMEV
ncbi:MAG: DNA cytosine methyltransferase [Hungatella sp.]|jgi:DNA (cytosine-5)-methyltransferase 1|nr:DNA cytosine methyltransferase [Hungatella sp.]